MNDSKEKGLGAKFTSSLGYWYIVLISSMTLMSAFCGGHTINYRVFISIDHLNSVFWSIIMHKHIISDQLSVRPM